MSTRSLISVEVEKDHVRYVYCHTDGDPEGVGKTLVAHYGREKALELLALGHLSQLEAEIGTQHPFNARPENECTFYHRDRGDSLPERPLTTRLDNLQAVGNQRFGVEFVYVLGLDNVWYVAGLWPVTNFRPVTEIITVAV